MCHELLDGEICPTCKRRFYKGKGRRLKLADEQIELIVKNFLFPIKGQTREEFCKDFQKATGQNLAPRTYRNIVYGHIKNTDDQERIDRIAEKHGLKIKWDGYSK